MLGYKVDNISMIGVITTMSSRLKGVLILLPLLGVLFLGNLPLYIAALILSILGLNEVYSSFKSKDIKPIFTLGYIFSYFLFIVNTFGYSEKLIVASFILLLFISTIYLLYFNRNVIDVAVTLLGIFYVVIPFQMIVMMYNQSPFQPNITFLLFIIGFSTDIFAYFSGKFFGKHKLIPNISPNKTIEGSLGAILGTIIVVSVYSLYFNLNTHILIPIALIGSVFAQLGDLFASSIKRYNNLKDFGNLIPGHGGIIDRFDSILFVSPLLYTIFILIY